MTKKQIKLVLSTHTKGEVYIIESMTNTTSVTYNGSNQFWRTGDRIEGPIAEKLCAEVKYEVLVRNR